MKRSEIEQLLPSVFQRTILPGTPIFALLEVMEGLHSSCEDTLLQLDRFFDPYRTPDRFVPMLANWVDLDRLLPGPGDAQPVFPSGFGRLRELIVNASFLSKWRGTATGLLRFLETATGIQGFEVDESVIGEDGSTRPFHIRVHVPQTASQYLRLIERIVDMEKPAYVTYDVNLEEGGEE